LIQAGCNVDSFDLVRTTPLDYSIGRNSNFARKFMEMKLESPIDEESIFLKHFQESVGQYTQQVGVEFFYIISKEAFLEGQKFMHFDECKVKNLHHTGITVSYHSTILFISHRWESRDHPDPKGNQFRIAEEFLEQTIEGDKIEWIWLDYSCINQDKNSDEFWQHLKNIPTSIVASTHCLVIPKTAELESFSNAPYTDMKDYLSRGWCKYEAVGALTTGTITYVALSIQASDLNFTEFVKLDSCKHFKDNDLDEEGFQGFKYAAIESLRRNVSGEDKLNAWSSGIKDIWYTGVIEPSSVIARSMVCVNHVLSQSEEILKDIIELRKDPNELIQEHPSLKVVGKALGNFTSEDDRSRVACFLLSLIAMCMHRNAYKVSHTQKYYEPSSYENICFDQGICTEPSPISPDIFSYLSSTGMKFFQSHIECFNWVNLNQFTTSGFIFGVFDNGAMAGWIPWGDSLVSDEFSSTFSYYYGKINVLGQFFIKGVYPADVRDCEYGQLLLSCEDDSRILHCGDAVYDFMSKKGARLGGGRAFYDLVEIDPFDPFTEERATTEHITASVRKVKKSAIQTRDMNFKAASCFQAVSFDLAIQNKKKLFCKAVWAVNSNTPTINHIQSFGQGTLEEGYFELRLFYSDGANEMWYGKYKYHEKKNTHSFTDVRYVLSPWKDFETLILGYDNNGKRLKPVVGNILPGLWKNQSFLESGTIKIDVLNSS